MNVETNSNFDFLDRSPLDQFSPPEPEPIETEPELARWVASRFNVLSTTEDGQLIVWNTFRGSISAFSAAHRAKIKSLLTRRPFEARAEGVVGYLRKRGFLVKEGTDEYRRFLLPFGQYHYRSDHLGLTLLASEDCNFRCEYCYEEFARGTMLPWVRSAIKKFLESRLVSLRFLTIAWFGGEPLYGFEAMKDLGPFFHQVATEHSITLDASITTNGYLLTPDIVEKLLSWQIKEMQVTIDGAPEDHDRLRHARNGEGTFSRILENIRSLRERTDDFTMQIRINFDPESYRRLEGFLDLLGDEFGNDPRFRLLLRPVGRWGGSKDQSLQVCGVGETRMVTHQLTENAYGKGLGTYDDLRKRGRFGAQVCYAARPDHFIIGADGKLMKCSVALDKNPSNIVGELTSDGELSLDHDKLASWTVPVFPAEDKCKKCVILPVCQSMACPYRRIRGRETYCPPLRRNLKKNLLGTQKSPGTVARAVEVKQRADTGTSLATSSS